MRTYNFISKRVRSFFLEPQVPFDEKVVDCGQNLIVHYLFFLAGKII
jgi:hypothetical protein